jgi:hypothetical protein
MRVFYITWQFVLQQLFLVEYRYTTMGNQPLLVLSIDA